MLAERTVYGRDFRVTPVGLWVLQRASGLLLGPLVALHVWLPGMAANGWLNAGLLLVIVVHGYGGVRRMRVARAKALLYRVLALGWCVAVATLGTLAIISLG